MSAHSNFRAAGALATRIVETLRRNPSTMLQLCDELRVSHASIRVRLYDLMETGRVHYVETPTCGGRGLAHVWHLGAASKEQLDALGQKRAARSAVKDRGPIGVPLQVTTRAYAPTNRRDPLVAALFGDGPGRSAS